MKLSDALRIQPGDSIAFSGSGGKTTALFTLAIQLGGPVVATTTTHFSKDQIGFADNVILSTDFTNIQELDKLIRPGINLLISEEVEDKRVSGIPDLLLMELFQFTKKNGINLLIEADGSRQRAMKAPASHEPVIPSFIDHVVVVVGLSAFGKPLTSRHVHRVSRFAALAEINEGDEITSQALIKVITNDLGGLKGIPGGARRVCLLNQADNEQLQAQGHRLASSLLPAYDSVIVTSLSIARETRDDNINIEATSDANRIFGVHEPVVGIILAAGGSIRMGRPKQLLPWKRETLIHHVTSTVIGAGLDQIIVVVGASERQVREELIDLPVEIVVNQNWESGQSTSVQAGLSAITENCGSAIFFLADQPGISRTLIRSMIERHAATLAPIVAPIVDGQRGNPVLFDRSTFSDFDSIRGDTGGRELFSRYPVSWIEWHDPAVLSDIDTDDDYQRLISDST